MSKIINLSNMIKTTANSKRKARGPSSGKGKMAGRGENGQKAKRVMTLSQQSSIWRLSTQKVHLSSHTRNYNRLFVITQKMQKTTPLPKEINFKTLKDTYGVPFYSRKIKILGEKKQVFHVTAAKI